MAADGTTERPAARLHIPGRLPGLNEIINAKGNSFRGGYNAYSKMKSQWGAMVGLIAAATKFEAIERGYFTYLFYEPTRQRDPSNIVAGGVKIIEDALQEAGLLKNDGWQQVLGYVAYWTVRKHPGVTLFVTPDCVMTKDEAVCLDNNRENHRVKN